VSDDAFDRRRNRRVVSADRSGILLEDRTECLDVGIAAECPLAGKHLIQNGPEGKDVRAVVGGLGAHLLGRHIADRAENRSRLRVDRHGLNRGLAEERRLDSLELGQAEVENLEAAISGDEQVLRFQIAVDDSFIVGRRQAAGELHGIIERLPHRQRLGSQSLSKRFPFQ
jgi:hypothetical protein